MRVSVGDDGVCIRFAPVTLGMRRTLDHGVSVATDEMPAPLSRTIGAGSALGTLIVGLITIRTATNVRRILTRRGEAW